MFGSFIKKLALSALVVVGGFVGSAQASVLFNFTEVGSGISASGVLTTTNNGGGNYSITGISGSLNGNNIDSLFAPGGYQGNDNLLFVPAAPTLVDFSGFSYTTSAGNFNVYYDVGGSFIGQPPGYATCTALDANCGGDTRIAFSVSPAVPEPSTWAMMILGFLGVGFMAYRRKSTAGTFRLA